MLGKKFPLNALEKRARHCRFLYHPVGLIELFLLPHVGMRLIMDDLGLDDMDTAYGVMLRSSDYGATHHTNDDLAEEIVDSIPRTHWLMS